MDDTSIVKLLWDRCEQALKELAAKYGRFCHKIALNILGSSEDAEECVNDTYLSVWNSIPPQRPSVLPPYVGRITKNHALNLYNKKHAEKRGGTPYNSNKSHSLVKFRSIPDGTDPSGALDFVLNVFQKSLAPVWAEEGINTFNNLIDHARILPVFRYFEAYDDIRGKTVGILAADNTLSHLSLLFVDAAYRSRGIGKRLVELLERESSSIGLSVNAEPSALPFYLKLGFHPVDPGPEGSGVIDEKDGIRSVKLYKKIKRDKNKGQVITPAANADDRT